ncbi:MAG: tetratricopeptide repeat protein [Elusimicrobia bacterium]|nr:tetratricopeptide repeat protein [Elusimicrobiota bacterium]
MEHRPLWPNLTIQDCRERIQRDPKDMEARLILGMTYRLQGDYRAALEMWNSILEIDPSHDAAKQLVRSLRMELMKINFNLE